MLSDEQLYNQQVAPKLREQEMKVKEELDRSMQSQLEMFNGKKKTIK